METNFWSDDNIAILKEMTSQKYKIIEISQKLQRTPAAIYLKINRLGIKLNNKRNRKEIIKPTKFRRWSTEEIKMLIELLDQKQSIKNISGILNRSEVGILGFCQKIKISTKYQQIKDSLRQHKLRRLTKEKIIKNKLTEAKAKSLKRNFMFDLQIRDILDLFEKQNGLCYYSNKPMTFNIGDKNILTIDRVDSRQGYTKDNIVLARYCINILKMNSPKEEFIQNCRDIVNTCG